MPDNTLLIVSIRDRRVLQVQEGGLAEHAVLGPFSSKPNDMIVDETGRANVGPSASRLDPMVASHLI